MKWLGRLILTVMGVMSFLDSEASEKISLPLAPHLTRADIYVEPYNGEARGTLVLCPGAMAMAKT